MKTIFGNHSSDKMLDQLMHPFNSQKNESLNHVITKVAPKDMQFGSSRQLQFRVALVVAVDSVGYQEFLRRLWIGLDAGTPRQSTMTFLNRQDEKKKIAAETAASDGSKTKRAKVRKTKLDKQYKDDAAAEKKHLVYNSGTACGNCLSDNTHAKLSSNQEDVSTQETSTNTDPVQQHSNDNTNINKRKKRTACKCGATDHLSANSKKCHFNKKRRVE